MNIQTIFCIFSLLSSATTAIASNDGVVSLRGLQQQHRRLNLPDFTVSSASIDVVQTDSEWDVNVNFLYPNGLDFVTDNVGSYNVRYYDYDTCSIMLSNAGTIVPPNTIIPGTMSLWHSKTDKPVTFGENDQGVQTYTLPISVNPAKAAEDTEIYFPDTDVAGLSHCKFCVMQDIYYQGILVQVVRVQVQVDVTLDETGEFGNSPISSEVAIRGSDALQASAAVSLTYNVNVFPCDENAQKYAAGAVPEAVVGKPIRFGVELAEGQAGAHVAAIKSLTYSTQMPDPSDPTGNTPLPAVSIVENGQATNSLTNVNCDLPTLGGEFLPWFVLFIANLSIDIALLVSFCYTNHFSHHTSFLVFSQCVWWNSFVLQHTSVINSP